MEGEDVEFVELTRTPVLMLFPGQLGRLWAQSHCVYNRGLELCLSGLSFAILVPPGQELGLLTPQV